MPFQPGNLNWAALAALGSGNTVGEQIGNANNVMLAQQPIIAQQQQQNKTLAYLQQAHPELAAQVAAGMPVAEAWRQVNEAKQPKKPNLMNVGDGLIYNADTQQWIQPPAGMLQSQTESGLQIQYGVDAQGNVVPMQATKDGKLIRSQMPEGVTLQKEPIKMDVGTHYMLYDPVTRQPIGTIPKNNTEQQAQITEGKLIGDAKGVLPAVKSTAATIKSMIADVKNDSYRERGTGLSSVFNNIPATGGYDFQRKVDQLGGQAFLQAIQQMQGFGALSNQEGQTAKDAIARLDTAQSEEAFNKALSDLEAIIDRGVAKAEQMAGNSVQPKPTDSGVVDYQDYFK